MIDLIALSAAKKHADLLAMGLTSVSVDNTNKSITFTLAADGSQHTIYFDQPLDGVSIIGVEIKNGHLICLMSDGSEIDAGVLPSGGSGGSVPKPLTYDYMPEGYPSKSVQTVTLLEAQEVAFSDIDGIYAAISPVPFELTEGETYTVVWDGIEYKCVCYTAGPTGGVSYIGNPAAFGLEATGEPFVYTLVEMGYIWASYDTATTHTIGVTASPETITPMSYDYMPEGYPKKTLRTVTLMAEQEVAFAFDSKNGVYAAQLTKAPAIAKGQTYTVNWDGTEYECVCYVFNSTPVLGNLSITGDGGDTGEPFIYIFATRRRSFVTLDTAASHTISVKTVTEVITPMAEEYLPDTVATKSDVEAVESTANDAQNTANNAQTTANAAKTAAENAQSTASAKLQLMKQNTVTTTTTIGTIKNSVGSVPVKGLNIAVGSTIKFTADNNVSGETVWDRPVKQISMHNNVGGTVCLLGLELSHDGETYNFTNKTISSILSNLVIEYEKVIIPKIAYPERNEGAWLPPYLIANCLYLTKQSTSSSSATLYRITIDDSGIIKIVNTSDGTEVQFIQTDEHINELINTALSKIGIAEEGAY